MIKDIHSEKILILDFGSQYTMLIARRVRELNVYCEIHPFNYTLQQIKDFAPKGIILSGGPSSVYDKDSPISDQGLFELGVPVLGICYGMQLTAFQLGGEVVKSDKREYGLAHLDWIEGDDIFADMKLESSRMHVWMSHGDRILKVPPGFKPLAGSSNSPVAAMGDTARKIFGVQFHPEVVHTPRGKEILSNFLFKVCSCSPSWTMSSFIDACTEEVRAKVGKGKVILALSGGVDSSVVAALLNKAIGENLTCIFVNNGVLRKDEADRVIEVFRDSFHLNLVYVDAAERFLSKLAGVTDPEKKRKIIGGEFIAIFEEEANKVGEVEYLGQGTLYPDVIESVSYKGPSATIKSHHNVGGLPEKMKLKLIEPLKELFKDEVRELGRELGMPERIVDRHPFPGPGLAVRIVGEVTAERVRILQEADAVVIEEIRKAGLYHHIWQAFAVLLPVKSVGVMGDERTYENTIAVRAVESLDGMTADWSRIPYDTLGVISNRIINEIRGVNRVVYDISSKPPATIEWE